jgi:hypothetical protein
LTSELQRSDWPEARRRHLWPPERLRHLAIRMLSHQADILDQVGTATHQALQLALVSVASPPRADDSPDFGEARAKPAAPRDLR